MGNNGSVVGNGSWECLFSNNGRQYLTSPNPNDSVLCYTVYTCIADVLNQRCIPNANVAGQSYNKIIKIANQCPGGG